MYTLMALLLTQNNRQLVKAVEKIIELDIWNGIYRSKHSILKNYSIFYPEAEKVLRNHQISQQSNFHMKVAAL